jgi:hypothetical protein
VSFAAAILAVSLPAVQAAERVRPNVVWIVVDDMSPDLSCYRDLPISTPHLDRLASGDADALDKVLEDRLDRLYVAKVYLQSDAATANTDALRQVVDDLADTEYERHRALDVDGETERGQVH